jgi:hypothetical protein
MSAAPTDLVVAEPTAPVSTPQFFRGFEGAAVEPFPEAIRKILAEPVNPGDVEIKPDGIVFLPGVAWRRILTRAFGAGGWAIVPRTPARVMGNLVIYHGALVCLGRFISEAIGECFYREGNANMSYASCIEGARTDCIGRCARDLGYAAELWDANWREDWKTKYATTYEMVNRKTGEKEKKWKLKNRVSNPHDLMVGAGGVAPEPAPVASASASSPPSPATGGSAGSSAAPAAAPASTSDDSTDPASPDTGEAASEATLDALTAEIRRRKWTRSYAVTFLQTNFSVDTMSALTQQQAARALVLVMARGGAK